MGCRPPREQRPVLSRALGEEVVHNDVPPEVYRGFGFPGRSGPAKGCGALSP